MSKTVKIEIGHVKKRLKPYPSYKDSGIEWLGEIPTHWDIARLKSTIDGCQNGIWGEDPTGNDDDVVCVRVADFDRVRAKVNLNDPTRRRIPFSQLENRSLSPGDLLLEKSGGGEQQPVGAVVLYDHKAPAVCSNFIARVRVNNDHEPGFLCYLHNVLYSTRLNIRSIKQSTGIQNLDSNSYFNEYVALPDLTEQRSINSFLDRETAKIDALIAKRERLIELLNEKRMALINQAVTKGLEPNVPMKDSGVEWLGEIPAHWDTTFLDKLIDPLRRITYGIVQPGEPDPDGIPMVRGQNYSRGWSPLDEIFRVSPAIEAPYRRARLKPDDIVMTIVGAGTGNVAIVPDWLAGANLTQTTARIALDMRRGNNRYFAYQLQSVVGTVSVELTVKGAAQPGLNLGHIAKYRVVVPPVSEEERIADFLDSKTARFDGLIAKVRDAIDRLKELRTGIISAAVTGKIDVREEVAS